MSDIPKYQPYVNRRRTIQTEVEVPLGGVKMEVSWFSDDVDLTQLIEGIGVAVSALLSDLDRENTGAITIERTPRD